MRWDYLTQDRVSNKFLGKMLRTFDFHYGQDGPGIESRWKRDFPHPSRPTLGSIHLPIQGVQGLSPEYSSRGVALTTHPI